MKTALTIAGSDCSGGAGIQADLKTFTVFGVFGMSVVTAITAQNTRGVTDALLLEPALVRGQIEAIIADLPVNACKTGMLGSAALIETVADAIDAHRLEPYVCDPVMFAKSGAKLLRDDAVEAMRRRLLPLAVIVTPNRREAALLTGADPDSIQTLDAARETAQRLIGIGARSVIIKAVPVGRDVADLFHDGESFEEFRSPRLPDGRNHGSGCAFSAAIAAGLAGGMAMTATIEQARRLVTAAIRHSPDMGQGSHPVNVMAFSD